MSVQETNAGASNDNDNVFNLEWYYIDKAEKETKGPFSIRDLDVFIRTNILDSNTYVWKHPMETWKKIFQIEELKELINSTQTEVKESIIRNQIQLAYGDKQNLESKPAIDNYFLSNDGFWHLYNPITKEWSKQAEKPVSQYSVRKASIDEEDEGIINESSLEAQKKESKEVAPDVAEIKGEKKNSPQAKPKEGNQANTMINKKRKLQYGENIEKILTEAQIKQLERKKRKAEKQKEKKKQKWYTSKVNSNIYVSGLPSDVNEHQIMEYFSKCGFIRKESRTGQFKIKIYKDSQGKNKGDALISFLREESVALAIDMLNESEFKSGHIITVEKAKFEQKGEYKAREKVLIDDLQRYKMRTDVNRMLGWEEEDNEKGLRIVVLKNMFEPNDFLKDLTLKNDIEQDIVEECETNFGPISKFQIFDEHPEGIIKIKFSTPVGAEKCINGINGRMYNGRKVEAFFWDGKTDYSKFKEGEENQIQRIENFGQWLETENVQKEDDARK